MENLFPKDLKGRQFYVLVVAGILFAICTLYQFFIWQQFKAEYEKTFGIIVKNKLDKEKKYYPVIRFKTLDNQRVSFTAPESSSSKYKEGDTVYVYYDLLNADDAKLAGGEYKGIVIFLGLTVLAWGLAFYLHTRNQRPTLPPY
jgi:hypothetical protein